MVNRCVRRFCRIESHRVCPTVTCLVWPARSDIIRTIELTIGMVCACLPPINLFIEKFFKPIISRNFSRRHLLSTPSPWRIMKRSKWVTGSPCFSTTLDNIPRRAGFDATVVPGNDVEQGYIQGPITAISDRLNVEPVAELEGLHHLDLQKLLRHDSADGRREGWLATKNSDDSSFVEGQSEAISNPRAQVTLQQLRQDARELIIPGRIWDGTQRSLEAETCSSRRSIDSIT